MIMKNSANIKQYLKIIDNWIWNGQKIPIARSMARLLEKDNIVIADVGSAGGVEDRWLPIMKYLKLLCFEPDLRSYEASSNDKIINFPVALAEKKGKRQLFLTPFSGASSLYRLNTDRLDDFANSEAHKVAGSSLIDVDTLDNCLAGHSGIKPDFIKVDAEGGDLDVLKGGRGSLAGVKGIKIEVSFLERYVGAPLFGEADSFLKEQGFDLFILDREHWIRKNSLYGTNSNPQIIWADAVYFVRKDVFIGRIRGLQEKERASELVKYILILLTFSAHDYALEILDGVSGKELIPLALVKELMTAIKKSVELSWFGLLRQSLGLLFGLVVYILLLPFGRVRVMGRRYLKKRLGGLVKCLNNMTRNGPYEACLHD